MVYVFLADGFEEMEAIAPIDLLRRAGAEVVTVAVTDPELRKHNVVTRENGIEFSTVHRCKNIVGAHGIRIVTDITDTELTSFDETEMIVLPGGMPGTLNEEASEAVQAAIDHCMKKDLPIGAICAAPSILGHKGILDGKKAVCYPGFERELHGADICCEGVVTDGNITTARGAGVAAEFALELVRILCGEEKSRQIREAIISK